MLLNFWIEVNFRRNPAPMIDEEFVELDCQNIDISGFSYHRGNGVYVVNNETFSGRNSLIYRYRLQDFYLSLFLCDLK